jgi:hypothetical protein
LISQQPRPVQYFASNPIICEASQQSFKNINQKKKHTHTHTSRSTPKTEEVWKKFGTSSMEEVEFFSLCNEVFVSFLSS